MLFAVLFTDGPEQGNLRAQNLDAHIRWVADHRDVVLVAGSLRVQPNSVPRGALWIVEADSKLAVLDLVKSDPFYVCGLRNSVEILHWSKAFEEKVLV